MDEVNKNCVSALENPKTAKINKKESKHSKRKRDILHVKKESILGNKAIKWIAQSLMMHSSNPETSRACEVSPNKYTPKSVSMYDVFSGASSVTVDNKLLTARTRSKRARLNVGGQIHEVLWEKLKCLPNSRLGRISLSEDPQEILSLCDDYVPSTDEFYFDRPVYGFAHVIGLYYTGQLHILDEACVLGLGEELSYWGICESHLERCCLQRYYQRREAMEEEIRKNIEICSTNEVEENFGSGQCSVRQKLIWDFVEKPQTSMAARVFAVISVFFILLSVVALNLSTVPRETVPKNETSYSPKNFSSQPPDEYVLPNKYSELIEVICIIWFSVEFAIRLLVAPNKIVFLKSPMNIIDMIAIIPFYLSKICETMSTTSFDSMESAQKALLMFRILRILRVLKLARHSQGLQALGYTLTQSYKELGMLMMFVVLWVLVFSSLAYFAEKTDNPKQFTSIPATFWWAIITMTTVGYGDITPRTAWGKLIGSVCCICGVLVVGLPIPIIVNNFANFYQNQIRREKVLRHQRLKSSRQRNSSTTIKADSELLRSELKESLLQASATTAGQPTAGVSGTDQSKAIELTRRSAEEIEKAGEVQSNTGDSMRHYTGSGYDNNVNIVPDRHNSAC